MGWGEGLATAKDLLETLTVPYLPIIGDNEIIYGDEANFADVFASQMEWLAGNTEDWNYGGQSVWNPEESKDPTLPTLPLPTKGFDSSLWTGRQDCHPQKGSGQSLAICTILKGGVFHSWSKN